MELVYEGPLVVASVGEEHSGELLVVVLAGVLRLGVLQRLIARRDIRRKEPRAAQGASP